MLYKILVEQHLEEKRGILVIENRAFSYAGIDKIIYRILKLFSDRNIVPDDRILIFADNNMPTIFTILACLAGGMVFVLADAQMSADKRAFVIRNTVPKATLGIQKEHVELCSGIVDLNKSIEDICYKDYEGSENIKKQERKRISLYKMAGILYTSGSTGEPRGVISCGHQILYCTKAINKALQHSESDKILSILPLSFDYGLYQVFLALDRGFRVYIQRTRKIQSVISDLAKLKITGFPGNPTLFRLMVKSRLLDRIHLPELRYMTSTGEVFPESLIGELEEALPGTWMVPMYGLTECKRVSIMPLDKRNMADKKGSCGKALPGVKVYLRNVDQKTRMGELVVEGPNVMDGYWRAPEETEMYFYGQGNNRKLYTGDLFFIDKEGFLYFKGRIKRIIKLRGYRFGCEEVESIVLKIRDVEDCAVFSFMENGEEYPAVCAVSGEETVEGRIEKTLVRWHPAWKNVAIYVREEEFPRNIHGKVDFYRVRKEWMEHDV